MSRTKGIRRRSKLQENRVAEEVKGQRQKASGASDFAKGDVRKVGELKIECKTTGANSYYLKKEEILKIQAEAVQGGAEDWAMQIEFQNPLGLNKKIAVIDWQTFLDLREKVESLEKQISNLKDIINTEHEEEE